MPLPSFSVVCAANRRIAQEVHELRFGKPEGFAFAPGQYVMMDFPLIGNESDIQPRAYSIASTPEEDGLLFVFKLVPNGRASRWVAERLKAGDMLRIRGPLGVFTLRPGDTRDLLFVCTSTGNAPFRSIIRHALENGDRRKMDMVFGVRHEADLFWVDEFENLSKEHANFAFHAILSRPGEGWKGLRGHVQDSIPAVAPDVAHRSVYVCGNPEMTKEVKARCLTDWGMEKKQVKVEEYV